MFTLKGDDYLFPPNYLGIESNGYCALALGWFVSPSSAPWVLGTTFMRQFYTAYDFDLARVGFSPSSFASGDDQQYELTSKVNSMPVVHWIVDVALISGLLYCIYGIFLVVKKRCHPVRQEYDIIL